MRKLRWALIAYTLFDLLLGGACGGFFLLTQIAGAQNNQLATPGSTSVSCKAVTASTSANPGTAAGCVAFNVIGSAPYVTWQILTTGSPASVTVNMMGSLDGINWTQIDTASAAGTRTVGPSSFPFLGCIPVTLTGGTAPTITCQFSPGLAGPSGVSGGGFAYGVDTGVVNAYVVALSPPMASLTVGNIGCFKTVNANTSNAPTVAFNGLAATTIVRFNNLVLNLNGDINTTEPNCVIFDGTNFDLLNPQSTTGTGQITLANAPGFATKITTPLIATTTKCAAVGTGANPSVASCAAAAAGVFSCAVAGVGNCQVNTTAMINANSTVLIWQDASTTTGTLLSVTCNVTPTVVLPFITAKVNATSFSFVITTPVTNPDCFEYMIIN